jgi:NAD(P)H dehydrogenase (quinone)
MIAITGATGHLGRLTLNALLKTVPADQLVALVRDPAKATDIAALGVQLRPFDYAQPTTAALTGIDKLLLISSNILGPARVAQHKAVIDAAKAANIKLLAYTSVLNADTSTLVLARDHKATEALILASGLPYVFLRNGWYLENHTASLAPALQHGAILGAAGDGLFAAAARQDYAEAAAVVLTTAHPRNIYELAGDTSYTLTQLAADVATQSGKPVVYNNLPEEAFAAALLNFGLPSEVANMLADSDTRASHGELNSNSTDLRTLINHPTTTLATAVKAALSA